MPRDAGLSDSDVIFLSVFTSVSAEENWLHLNYKKLLRYNGVTMDLIGFTKVV